MKRIFFPLMIAICTTTAAAENVKVYVPREGGGVTQKPGNVTPQEAAILMGDNAPPPNATGIILERGEEPRWTDQTPSEVDREYKGDGTPETELFPEDEPPTKPLPLPDNEKEPIELFPEDETADGRILPQAGNWIGVVQSQSLNGCEGPIADAVAAQTAALNGSAIVGRIGPDFNPSIAMPQLDWEKTGRNTWNADFSPAGNLIRMQWQVTIKSPDLIENTQQFDALSCKALTRVDYVRQ